VQRVVGYDLPPFDSMLDFKIWEEVEPPKGTVYNYPNRPFHNAKVHLAASEAAPEIAVQIYNRATMPTMLARLKSGQSIKKLLPGQRMSSRASPADRTTE
jgi:hypothetical protein